MHNFFKKKFNAQRDEQAHLSFILLSSDPDDLLLIRF